MSTAASTSTLISGVVLLNPTIIFNLMNLVEMFSYILLFDIEFHQSFIEFMIGLKKTTKLPSLSLPKVNKSQRLPEKYALFEVDSSLILINSGYIIFCLSFTLIISLILHRGSLSKSFRISSLCLKVKKLIYFKWLYRICIQGTFDFAIFSLLTLIYSDNKSLLNIFDKVCGIFVLVICN